MAGSNLNDPSTWRLATSTGLKYKYLGMDGSFNDEQGQITSRSLIQSGDLYAFIALLMPPPTVIGNVSINNVATLPGFNALAVKAISFKSLDSAVPSDPFGFDAAAPSGTYQPAVEMTVEYNSDVKKKDTSESDPFTFLEISGEAKGEFITTDSPGSKWRCDTNPDETADPGDGATWDDYDGFWINSDTGEVVTEEPTKATPEINRNPKIPMTIIVPTTEWTVTWSQIPFDLFQDVIIHRLRLLLGRLNSTKYTLLFGAFPETLLFNGYSYTQKNTWRNGEVRTPPITLTMKFTEKRVVSNGLIVGHNHFWRPGYGWCRLLHDGTHNTYRFFDFNLIHKI